MTAVASVPAERMSLLGGQLVGILESRDEEPWVLAAIAAATPLSLRRAERPWLDWRSGCSPSATAAAICGARWREGWRRSGVGASRMKRTRALAPARGSRSRSARLGRWLGERGRAPARRVTPLDRGDRDHRPRRRRGARPARSRARPRQPHADRRAVRRRRRRTLARRRFAERRSGRRSPKHFAVVRRRRGSPRSARRGDERARGVRARPSRCARGGSPGDAPGPPSASRRRILEGTVRGRSRRRRPRSSSCVERARSGGEQGRTTRMAGDLSFLWVLALRLGGHALDACGRGSKTSDRGADRRRTTRVSGFASSTGSVEGDARSPGFAQGSPQRALLASRGHDARYRAGRGRRHPVVGAVRSLVGARDRSPHGTSSARDCAPDDGRGGAGAVLRAGGGPAHRGLVERRGWRVGSRRGESDRGSACRGYGARTRPRRAGDGTGDVWCGGGESAELRGRCVPGARARGGPALQDALANPGEGRSHPAGDRNADDDSARASRERPRTPREMAALRGARDPGGSRG